MNRNSLLKLETNQRVNSNLKHTSTVQSKAGIELIDQIAVFDNKSKTASVIFFGTGVFRLLKKKSTL